MNNRHACWRSGSVGLAECLLLAACSSGSAAPLDGGLASPSNGSSGSGLSGSGEAASAVASNDSGNTGAGTGSISSAGQAAGGSGGGASGSSGGSGTAAGSGRLGTLPTMLPSPNGVCPTFQNGAVTVNAGGGTIQATLWVGNAGAQGGPLILYWHGTGSDPTSEVSVAFDTHAVVATGGIVAGFLANSRTGTATGTTGNYVWYQSDALFADQLVACALQAKAIDPRRIHTAGYSAGALQAVYMSYARSGYIASAIGYSGGTDGLNQTKYQDASNVPAAIAAHGAQGKDVVGIDFAQASATWESAIKQSGGFSIDCNDGGNHIDFFGKRAPALRSVALQFFIDHPFKTAPEPYTTLPSAFPSYCKLD